MKKLICAFSFLVMMLFCTAVAFAAPAEITNVIDEDYDLKSIKTMAIATPYYTPSAKSVFLNEKKRPNAPKIVTTDMIVQTTIDVAKKDEIPIQFISDKQINEAILNSTGTDITALDKKEAKDLYKANIGKYADAYVMFTFSNDSYVSMTADIYDAKTNKWILSYRIVNGGMENDTIDNYNMFMHKFFRVLTSENKNN